MSTLQFAHTLNKDRSVLVWLKIALHTTASSSVQGRVATSWTCIHHPFCLRYFTMADVRVLRAHLSGSCPVEDNLRRCCHAKCGGSLTETTSDRGRLRSVGVSIKIEYDYPPLVERTTVFMKRHPVFNKCPQQLTDFLVFRTIFRAIKGEAFNVCTSWQNLRIPKRSLLSDQSKNLKSAT